MYSDHQAELMTERASAAQAEALAKAKQVELEAQLTRSRRTDDKLAKGQTDAEKRRSSPTPPSAARRSRARGRRTPIGRQRQVGRQGPAPVRKYAGKKDVSDNPLEGLRPRRASPAPPPVSPANALRLGRALVFRHACPREACDTNASDDGRGPSCTEQNRTRLLALLTKLSYEQREVTLASARRALLRRLQADRC